MILFDTGSTHSFISRRLAVQLRLKFHFYPVSLFTAQHTALQTVTHYVLLRLDVLSFDFKCWVMDSILTLPAYDFKLQQIWPEAEPLLAQTYPSAEAEVDLLIGEDQFWNVVTGDIMKHKTLPLAIMESSFGYFLTGSSGPTALSQGGVMIMYSDALEQELQRLWMMEPEAAPAWTADEQYATERYESNVRRQGEHYVTTMMLKPERQPLVNNFKAAYKRLSYLEQSLKKDDRKREAYIAAMKEYRDRGDVELVHKGTFQPVHRREVFYLPHRGVFCWDRESTKCRIVFDASAKDPLGVSLNENLLPGPKLQVDIVRLLFRFRKNPVALISDVSKMFLNIFIEDGCRDLVRFLWRDLDDSKPPAIYRFRKVIFGARDSPFLAIKTVLYHCQQLVEHSQEDALIEAARIIQRDLYVDDCTTGASSVEEAIALQQAITTIFRGAGMRICKWLSNSVPVIDTIPQEDRAKVEVRGLPIAEEAEERKTATKVLGVAWNPRDDTLFLRQPKDLEPLKQFPTKRSISSVTAKVAYDPLGLVTPYVIRGKIILQQLWKDQVTWDAKVRNEVADDWSRWVDEMKHLESVRFPRFVGVPELAELHGFSDASAKAYGGVVYVRSETTQRLYASKARVCPIKPHTTPRMELQAALMLTELAEKVAEEIGVDPTRIFCYTDSTVVLAWIHQENPGQLGVYVANRVKKIRQRDYQWGYVNTKDNVADLVSRGTKCVALNDDKWQKGPVCSAQAPPVATQEQQTQIMREMKSSSGQKSSPRKPSNKPRKSSGDPPNQNGGGDMADAPTKGVKGKRRAVDNGNISPLSQGPLGQEVSEMDGESGVQNEGAVFVATTTPSNPECMLVESLWRTLCYKQMLRVLTRVFRWFLKATGKSPQGAKAKALSRLIQVHQQKHFPKEIEWLKSHTGGVKFSPLVKLSPWYDGTYLRVGGRLQNSAFDFDVKHPIILHPNDALTNGLIMQIHEGNQHAGCDWTLNRVRELYWILRSRRSIRRILHGCKVCQRFRTANAGQRMAPLPKERTAPGFPFEYCATDLGGPILVRLHKGTTETTKTYIVLFTCLTSRAVHLELAASLSAEDFLLAFKRFINRRGPVRVMYSDNGTNLRRTAKDLQNIYSTLSPKGYALEDLQWKFSNALAPWEGGVWERLMRSVKTPLKKITGKALFTFTEMYTILTDIENMLNQRPLLPRAESAENREPITPAHLLIGRSLRSIPTVFTDVPGDFRSTTVAQGWRHREMVTAHFWKRWTREYLVTLNERSKWHDAQDFKVDQVVLLQDEVKHKGLWPLARIVSTTQGRDGLVRSVQLRLPSNKIVTRPVRKICRLECEEGRRPEAPIKED